VTQTSNFRKLTAGKTVDKIILSTSGYRQLTVSLLPNIERCSNLEEILGH
jgi:hypothetical protein